MESLLAWRRSLAHQGRSCFADLPEHDRNSLGCSGCPHLEPRWHCWAHTHRCPYLWGWGAGGSRQVTPGPRAGVHHCPPGSSGSWLEVPAWGAPRGSLAPTPTLRRAGGRPGQSRCVPLRGRRVRERVGEGRSAQQNRASLLCLLRWRPWWPRPGCGAWEAPAVPACARPTPGTWTSALGQGTLEACEPGSRVSVTSQAEPSVEASGAGPFLPGLAASPPPVRGPELSREPVAHLCGTPFS